MLIHLGDILAKGKHKDSLAVLDFMASRNVTGIRGNHDQMVIEWRAWRERALSHSGGAKWLKEMERKSKKELSAYVKKGKGSGWKRIPKGWEFMGDHYRIARYSFITNPQALNLFTYTTWIIVTCLHMNMHIYFLSHLSCIFLNSILLSFTQESSLLTPIEA